MSHYKAFCEEGVSWRVMFGMDAKAQTNEIEAF